MGVQDLQSFLESSNLEGGAVSVDLLKIAKNVTQRNQLHNNNRKIRPIGNKLKLVIDAECCLDRLYGGYFSGKIFYFMCLENMRKFKMITFSIINHEYQYFSTLFL